MSQTKREKADEEDEVYQLQELSVGIVSLVDKPAIGKTFLIAKRADLTGQPEPTTKRQLVKLLEERTTMADRQVADAIAAIREALAGGRTLEEAVAEQRGVRPAAVRALLSALQGQSGRAGETADPEGRGPGLDHSGNPHGERRPDLAGISKRRGLGNGLIDLRRVDAAAPLLIKRAPTLREPRVQLRPRGSTVSAGLAGMKKVAAS